MNRAVPSSPKKIESGKRTSQPSRSMLGGSMYSMSLMKGI